MLSANSYNLSEEKLFYGFAAMLSICALAAILLEQVAFLLIPILLAGAAYFILNPKHLFYLFFILLPFSVEVELPGGFGTDLPSEPIMLGLLVIALLFILERTHKLRSTGLTHIISVVLILHIVWIAFTTLFSSNPIYSIKFLLAKSWYVIPFYFFPLLAFKEEKNFRKIFIGLVAATMIAITYVMFNHARLGFTFDSINKAVVPIFRNHVNYGILLTSVLPFNWYLFKTSKKSKGLYIATLIYLLLAIYLTYTRAAQLAVVLAIAIYFVVRWRLVKSALLIAVCFIGALLIFLSVDNRYLDFSPDYDKTITHKKFDNLLEATYKMQDISTVERFYRWIAGFYMIKESPWIGHGPATFYTQYKSYTVTSYKTFVSDNPEKSGIHNYYLMTAAEQGVPGLLIFLTFALLPIIIGERIYHRLSDSNEKALVMAAIICFTLIDIVILINDLIEADKVGPFYFLSAAIICYFATKKSNPTLT